MISSPRPLQPDLLPNVWWALIRMNYSFCNLDLYSLGYLKIKIRTNYIKLGDNSSINLISRGKKSCSKLYYQEYINNILLILSIRLVPGLSSSKHYCLWYKTVKQSNYLGNVNGSLSNLKDFG